MEVGLKYKQNKNLGQLVWYIDFDFEGDLNKHCLTTCYLYSGERSSGKSTLQSTASLSTMSTMKTKYMAVAVTCKEAIWLLGLLDDLGVFQKHIDIHYNSQSAIKFAKN